MNQINYSPRLENFREELRAKGIPQLGTMEHLLIEQLHHRYGGNSSDVAGVYQRAVRKVRRAKLNIPPQEIVLEILNRNRSLN